MNINKFTQKSMEAVQNCEKLATSMETSRSTRSICSTVCLPWRTA